ncbi:50S ribosomal protein L6 [Geotoga petraea]|jgi:large subunit ribosomal protein L6|uniref:Large ribosomal subunit protein uL6 n=1 Tax=Geotoga petraea TaxID=28234 RepID=A0A1G6I3T4_9BACT|nr:50S ribosomal protein L6 [Geotoga petraea]MDK2945459.1 large subunit ribosomal protein [Geotoga sp.]TGG89081.1 50S ribosomal protein L6 [Geotoga petraea]SDC01219.1 LSU ribosomal protein L6P [Geotoga petraea]
MSRIADKPTTIPNGVDIKKEGMSIIVKGKNGELKIDLDEQFDIEINENELMVVSKSSESKRKSNMKKQTALRGTYTSIIRNMIKGVTEGFEKNLEILGIGYRAQMQGNKLILNLGYSHPIEITPPEGITIEVPQPNKVNIKGIDKHAVGQVAAKIRKIREPNAYSGKGVKYLDEVIIKKEGKKV